MVISALTQPHAKYTKAFSITVSIAILISGPGRKVIYIYKARMWRIFDWLFRQGQTHRFPASLICNLVLENEIHSHNFNCVFHQNTWQFLVYLDSNVTEAVMRCWLTLVCSASLKPFNWPGNKVQHYRRFWRKYPLSRH